MTTKKGNDEVTYPNIIRQGELDYQSYLRVPELINLQSPQSNPPHHDETLFIIIHQTYELWFKLVLHELETVAEHMQKKEVLQAQHFVNRVVNVMKVLVQQIHILETMRPADYAKFRDALKAGSGFQSVQFREAEFFSGLKDERYFKYMKHNPETLARLQKRFNEPDLRTYFYSMLKELGFDIPKLPAPGSSETEDFKEKVLTELAKVFSEPQKDLPLYLLIQSLLEYDEQLFFWRAHHVRVVERIIGKKMGTGGSEGVDYLQLTLSKRCFPMLWEVTTRL